MTKEEDPYYKKLVNIYWFENSSNWVTVDDRRYLLIGPNEVSGQIDIWLHDPYAGINRPYCRIWRYKGVEHKWALPTIRAMIMMLQ